jgi:hypothetical protein
MADLHSKKKSNPGTFPGGDRTSSLKKTGQPPVQHHKTGGPGLTDHGSAIDFNTSANAERREESTRDMGLCKHCERRTTCRRPGPEGGVWHCDDYL